MKTAVVPNSPELTTLMKVNAELSVALEQYELAVRTNIVNEMSDAEAKAIHRIKVDLPNLADADLKVIQAALSGAIHQACEYQATYIGIHERTLGLTSEQAPAVQARVACDTYAQLTAHYWEQV